MNQLAVTIITAAIRSLFDVLGNHLGKPAGWVPTAQELDDINTHVDEATPEAEKKAAAERLGIPWPPQE